MIITRGEGPQPAGSSVTFECDTFYTMNGSATITCDCDGQWNGSAPTCYAGKCSLVLSWYTQRISENACKEMHCNAISFSGKSWVTSSVNEKSQWTMFSQQDMANMMKYDYDEMWWIVLQNLDLLLEVQIKFEFSRRCQG